MPWQRSAQPANPRPAYPVPEGESVRTTVLQAAWQRDRQVARRRLWWRWTLWGTKTYALPAMALLGVCAGLWFTTKATMPWLETTMLSTPTMTKTRTPSISPEATNRVDAPPVDAGQEDLPDGTKSLPAGMTPSLETDSTDVSPGSNRPDKTPVSSAALPDAASTSNPQLISEDWLHSKEP